MRAWEPDIDVTAEMVDDCYSGHGMGKLYDPHESKYGVSEATIFRHLKNQTLVVYSVIDHLLNDSTLGEIHLHFDKIWQKDEKVISVVGNKWLRGGNKLHSFKNKGGRRVSQIILRNIYNIPTTKFVLATENVGTGTAEEVGQTLLKAKSRIMTKGTSSSLAFD